MNQSQQAAARPVQIAADASFEREFPAWRVADIAPHEQSSRETRLDFYRSGYDHGHAAALASSPQPAAAAMWQYRSRPFWSETWGAWTECTEPQAKDFKKSPVLHDWAYEVRCLLASPPSAPAEVPLTDADKAILASIHHAHANALQALVHHAPDHPKLLKWTAEFQVFRDFYRRVCGEWTEQYDYLEGRGMHELRFDELTPYVLTILEDPVAVEAAVAWIVSELARKTNDERILAVQLAALREAASPPSAPKPLAAEDVLRAGGIISYLGVTFDSLDQLNAAIAAKEPRNGPGQEGRPWLNFNLQSTSA